MANFCYFDSLSPSQRKLFFLLQTFQMKNFDKGSLEKEGDVNNLVENYKDISQEI